MTHLIKYRQFYPDQVGFQFWRDRMVCLEFFGMRWCVVVYSPVEEKQAHAIVMQAISHAVECANYASTREVRFTGLLDYILSLINDELIAFKESRNINIFQGIGIALTVVDSEGRMAYAQGGDAVVMLYQNGIRHAKGSQDIADYRAYNNLKMMHARRIFGTYKTWKGFVSAEYRLKPGDVWFISTEANFHLMHDGLTDETVATLHNGIDDYWTAIKKIYNNSGLLYAGILVSGEFLSETTPDVIGMESIRIWNKWRKLDEQLMEDLPPGVGLYGLTAPHPKKMESAESPTEVSEAQQKTEFKPIEDEESEPWWRRYSWKVILLFLFVLSMIIRLINTIVEAQERSIGQ
jgi:hypothetical protein